MKRVRRFSDVAEKRSYFETKSDVIKINAMTLVIPTGTRVIPTGTRVIFIVYFAYLAVAAYLLFGFSAPL